MPYDKGVQELIKAAYQYGPDTQAYKALGDIIVQLDSDLLLFQYNKHCIYQRRWNDVEQSARSLVINWRTGQVKALTWRKFFNLGERPETKMEALPAGRFEATEKIDGSLGVVFFDGVHWRVVTRSQFASKQAQWAADWLRKNVKLSYLAPEYTYMTEMIYPGNRVVLNYRDKSGLVLLGARLTSSGAELGYPYLLGVGEAAGLEVVPRVDISSPAEFVQLAEEATGMEGWVLHWKNGLRVKVKTREYLRLHRLLIDLTPSRIRDVCEIGTLGDFLVGMPEEFAEEAGRMGEVVTGYVNAELKRLNRLFDSVWLAVVAQHGTDVSRAQFASYVQAHHAADAKYLFASLAQKPLVKLIYKHLDKAKLAELFPAAVEV